MYYYNAFQRDDSSAIFEDKNRGNFIFFTFLYQISECKLRLHLARQFYHSIFGNQIKREIRNVKSEKCWENSIGNMILNIFFALGRVSVVA